tara:strand:+ start:346 stop:780 length:435 start_codon:yes stop_codon:yes gene_type:complete
MIANKDNPLNIYSKDRQHVYFYFDELACRFTRAYEYSDLFVEKLIDLRSKMGQPMMITSGARSYDHNKTIGGHPKSLHVYDKPFRSNQVGALAIDVATRGSVFNYNLITLALDLGWSVGVSKSFIHLDRRDFIGLKQGIFGYGT